MEIQKLRMQKISSIPREAGEIFKRLAGQVVQRVAYQGMSDGCQMDSDLMRAADFRLTSNVVVLMVREITFANDFDALPLGLAAHTEPMSGCGTRPMGVRIS